MSTRLNEYGSFKEITAEIFVGRFQSSLNIFQKKASALFKNTLIILNKYNRNT